MLVRLVVLNGPLPESSVVRLQMTSAKSRVSEVTSHFAAAAAVAFQTGGTP